MAPQVVFEKVHLLPLVSTAMYTFIIVAAYFIAHSLDQVESTLPFIRSGAKAVGRLEICGTKQLLDFWNNSIRKPLKTSHVLAYPPQSALGIIFGAPAALLAIISFIVKYVVIDHREKAKAFASDKNRDRIKSLNKAALFCGILSNISVLSVFLWPIGFPCHERLDMVMTAGVPHHLADLGVFVFFIAYIFIETYLTYSQRSVYKENQFVQFALIIGVVISAAGILLTVYSAISEIFHTLVDERTGIVQFTYKKYSFIAATCAASEWLFVGMCFTFVTTFQRNLKNAKIKFRLKSKQ